MMQNRHAIWVAQTGIFLALLIVGQIATRPFGTLVTGSVNNALFILALLLCGLTTAITLGIISPILAAALGVGPLWPFVPVIIAANLVRIILWYVIALRRPEPHKGYDILALIVSGACKFLVLYFGIVRLVVPLILGLPEPAATAVSAAFSYPQLITATIGGAIALLLYAPLSKALPRQHP